MERIYYCENSLCCDLWAAADPAAAATSRGGGGGNGVGARPRAGVAQGSVQLLPTIRVLPFVAHVVPWYFLFGFL